MRADTMDVATEAEEIARSMENLAAVLFFIAQDLDRAEACAVDGAHEYARAIGERMRGLHRAVLDSSRASARAS